MKNLLSAELLRLYKSKIFYVLSGVAFVYGIVLQLYVYFGSIKSDTEASIEQGFFGIGIPISFVIAVLVSLFVGTDYSDGTLRNKIINGKSRRDVYFSKLIICCFALLVIFALYYSSSLIFGLIFCGNFNIRMSTVIMTALILYLCSCSYVAIFTAIAMNCDKKAVVAVISLVLTIVMFFLAVAVTSALSEPEYYPESIYMDENGELINEPEQPNPNYPSGIKRRVLEVVNDAQPTGQCIQLSGALENFGYKPEFVLYATGLIIISTSFGMVLFKKKDIV